ncbi:hypothetical protein BGZ74_009680 [Mortierella antarctica]|nr:hypothetical protein BGZ74_009680 [Mortierella antarctica]
MRPQHARLETRAPPDPPDPAPASNAYATGNTSRSTNPPVILDSRSIRVLLLRNEIMERDY